MARWPKHSQREPTDMAVKGQGAGAANSRTLGLFPTLVAEHGSL